MPADPSATRGSKAQALCANDGQPTLPADAFDPEPVKRGEVRPSRMGRRRAIALLLIHLAVFAHILHWQLKGRTLSPVEPSEAMYTVATGAVNAGTVLLIVSLLSTLILGRWFCGWACHLVALQDLCAWLLKKLHIRPRPVRSRLLVWIPLLAGIHLFLFPAFVRWKLDQETPALSNELMRDDFWETFPGPLVAILTFLVCGFVIVYLLGAKGFCTYACPYGGLFGVIERFAPGRIRVTDACKGCGHCSAICTSNVRVAKEVHEYGMVVDPGCMKCLDCVSVCPEDALYFGFGKPAARSAPRVKHPKKIAPQFGLGEEITMVLSFSLTIIVLRGIPAVFAPDAAGILYGEMPQLFALGVAAIVAFTSVYLWRVLRRADVDFQKWTLKRDGSLTTAGKRWLAYAVLLHAFVLHSGVVQVLMFKAQGHWRATAPIEVDTWRQAESLDRIGGELGHAIESGDRAFELAGDLGLFPDFRVHKNRAWFALCKRDLESSAWHLERATEMAPRYANLWFFLARVRVLQGRFGDAWSMLAETRSRNSDHGPYQEPGRQLLNELARLGMAQQIYDMLRSGPDTITKSIDHVLLRARSALELAKNDEAFAAIEQVIAVPNAITKVPHLATWIVRFIGSDAARSLQIIEAQRAAQPDAYYLHVLGIEAAAAANQVGEAERIGRIMVARWADRAPPGFASGHPQMMLADVLEQRGEKREATQLREQARKINPAAWTPTPGPGR